MTAIVGYFDLKNQLPRDTLDTMLKAVYTVSGSERSYHEQWGGLGVVIQQPSKQSSFFECEDLSKIGLIGAFESSPEKEGIPRLDQMDFEQISLLRGGYIWVQMDVQKKQFIIVNDHFARHPLYIAKYKEAVLFSTQIKALLSALPNEQTLDKNAVAMMLTIGEVVGNQTLIEGVETIAAAQILTIDKEGSQYNPYWQYSYQQDFSINKKDAIQSIGEMLTQSVERAISRSEIVTVPLSGGLDSRFLLGLANKTKDVHAYTWGIPDCRDLIYAKKTAKKINCQHDCFEFTPNYLEKYADQGVWITEGQIPVINFHVLPYVNRLAADGNFTLLDGFAGDVVLGGNFIKSNWLNNPNGQEVANELWSWRLNSTVKALESNELLTVVANAKEIFSNIYTEYQGETSMDSVMAFLMDNRIRRTTTGGSEIFRTQFAVKQPFMDVDLMTAINQVPHQWRKRHRLYVDILNKFAPDVASVAWQRTCLPPATPYVLSWSSLAAQRAYKEARKYLPLPDLIGNDSPSQFGEWFQMELKAYVTEVLFSERTYDRNILPMNALEMAWSKHQTGEIDASSFLGAAISIELFARLFMDDLDASIQRFSRS